MADISVLARLIDGEVRNVELSSNSLVLQSVKIGTSELTKNALDKLVLTIDSATAVDASTLHHHNNSYYTKSQLASVVDTIAGASLIGVDQSPAFANISGATVQAILESIDTALGGATGIVWSTPVDASIVPDTADTYNLGSDLLPFTNAFAKQYVVNDGASTFRGKLSSDIAFTNSIVLNSGNGQDVRIVGGQNFDQINAGADVHVFADDLNIEATNFKMLNPSVPSIIGQVWTASGVNGEGYWTNSAPDGADQQLSNLTGTVAIPDGVDILALNDQQVNLGSSAKYFSNVWAGNLNARSTLQIFGTVLEGDLLWSAGTAFPSGASGVRLSLPATATGDAVGLSTADNSVADATPTKDIRLETGNKTDGTGRSGNIYLEPGTSDGGLKGDILLAGGSLELGPYTDGGWFWGAEGWGLHIPQGNGVNHLSMDTKDHASDSTDTPVNISIQTGYKPGNSSTQATGSFYLTTGQNAGSGQSGYVGIQTGETLNGSTGQSGDLDLYTGGSVGSGNSGYLAIQSGNSQGLSGNTGPVNFQSGNNTAAAGDSGQVSIFSGNSTNGDSGDLLLRVGSAGGTQGNIKLFKQGVAPSIGDVFTATATDGSGYWAAPAAVGSTKVETRTITAGEAGTKSLVLVATPITPAEVTLAVAGAPAQHYGIDFTVSGTTLTWNALGLDGILDDTDNLTILYVT